MYRKRVVLCAAVLCSIGFGVAINAQNLDGSMLGRAAECAEIGDSLLRLRCYDELFVVGPLQDQIEGKQPRETKVDTPVVPIASGDKQGAEAEFGSERVREAKIRRESPKKISSTIVKVRQKLRGQYVFELANGQIWEQVEVGRTRYRSDVEVTVFKSSFSSYTLDAQGIGRTKVKRIK